MFSFLPQKVLEQILNESPYTSLSAKIIFDSTMSPLPSASQIPYTLNTPDTLNRMPRNWIFFERNSRYPFSSP